MGTQLGHASRCARFRKKSLFKVFGFGFHLQKTNLVSFVFHTYTKVTFIFLSCEFIYTFLGGLKILKMWKSIFFVVLVAGVFSQKDVKDKTGKLQFQLLERIKSIVSVNFQIKSHYKNLHFLLPFKIIKSYELFRQLESLHFHLNIFKIR